ncbi:mechanosensitive ion channel family protein [Candidatus Uabimicrobium amorphum]|uniref:Putative MscS family protein n=1 Tax=Uabimicrobium amorphum TaxID=2596890 RepID=A0A5S9F3D4_UABAM|nr:mechanosensitive ion channel family protein [Candidatus Uabimicrobium amorphum]BBM84063.1 putative MscS family protein [Candidatus Uabimicrobium amorphum]
MEKWLEILQQKYWGNTLGQYAMVLAIIFIAVVVRFIVCSIVYKRLMNWVDSKSEDLDAKVLGKIKSPLGYIILFIGLKMATGVLTISRKVDANSVDKVQMFIDAFFATVIAFSIAWMLIRFVDILMIYMKKHASTTESKLDDQLVPLVSKSLKIFIILIAFITIAQGLGYSIGGLLAGLGIGGLALAMAAKDTLSNLFGSVTIFSDQPFQVGDWIKVNSHEGVVEAVGFRSTRIRTFYKTEVSIPNSVVANATIDNFSRMQRRRVSTTLGFTYETTPDQMEKALAGLRNVLKKTKGVSQDFYMVSFTGFGDSALEVLLYYFTDTTVWTEYVEIRERVNLAIMRALQKAGVEFAFNSMSVYLRSGEQGQVPKLEVISKK